MDSGHTDPADWAGLTPEKLPTPRGVPVFRSTATSPTAPPPTPTTAGSTTPSSCCGCPHGGTAAWSCPVHPATGSSTPTTAPSATGCSSAATRSRRPTRATPASTSTATAAHPVDAVAEWNHRVTQLTRAARATVAQPLPPAALAHAGHGDVQRRLPRALAAGEPSRAVRRRRRLGGHAVAGEGAGPNLLTFLPPALRHYPAVAEGGPGAEQGPEGDARGGVPARHGVPVAVLPQELLGPHPADLPRGGRPRVRRGHGGGNALLCPGRSRRSAVRRRLRLRLAAPTRCTARWRRSG